MKNRAWVAWLFLLPNLLGFLVFTSLPVLASLGLAFCSWDLFRPPRFVGLKNFVQLVGFSRVSGQGWNWILLVSGIATVLLTTFWIVKAGRSKFLRRNRTAITAALLLGLLASGFIFAWQFLALWQPNQVRFWHYLYNTLFLMLGIPASVIGSLFLAILLDQKLPGRNLFRLMCFIPSIVSGVGILILWKWIFNPDYGLMNNFLWSTVGAQGPRWLETTAWAKPAIVIMSIWASVGGPNMILYLAALQGVDPELYEAADLDGANFWHRFWHITWPLVSPTTFFILIMGIIAGFEGGFDAAYVMTKGGPAGSTTTLSYFIYQNAFQFFYMGKAAAASWVLFAMVLTVTLLNWRFGGKLVHY